MLEVASPERLVVREEVDDVQAPAVDGYLGILPGHAPMLTELGAGVLTVNNGGKRRFLAVQGGFLEVAQDVVRVATLDAYWADEVDVERARIALQRAMNVLENRQFETDVDSAEKAAALAKSQLEAYERSGGPKL
jgi:F-type H+-transporting ATPase subunit epsilon